MRSRIKQEQPPRLCFFDSLRISPESGPRLASVETRAPAGRISEATLEMVVLTIAFLEVAGASLCFGPAIGTAVYS